MSMPSQRARLARIAAAAVLSATGAVALVPISASAADPGAVVDDPGCRTSTLAANDDGSSGSNALPSVFRFFDRDVSTVYVNNNGNLSFGAPLSTYSGDIAGLTQPVVAPFFGDIDTRATGSGVVTFGTTTYGDRPAFCASWPSVAPYGGGSGNNTFQAYLVDRSDLHAGDFDVIFNYGQVQWDTASTSAPAQVGFTAADQDPAHVYVFPGSSVSGAFLDSNAATGLVNHTRESSVLGRYNFHFRNGVLSDVPPPDTTITSTLPPARGNDASPSFTYSSTTTDLEAAGFECRLSAAGTESPGAWSACPDTGISYEDVADGDWTFEVRALDVYGYADATPASASFTIDTTGPVVQLDATPGEVSSDTTPTFEFSSGDDDLDSFECRLDESQTLEPSSWSACESAFESIALGDGGWTFQVRATDDLGNTGAAVAYDFTVDTVNPTVTFTETPATSTNDSSPVFAWTTSEDVATTSCLLERRPASEEPAEWQACSSGDELQVLDDGDWRFGVRVIDAAGNESEVVSHDFTVDTRAPGVELTTTPDEVTNDNTPVFAWTSEDDDVASFTCRVTRPGDALQRGESSPWTACESGDALTTLDDGQWLFEVRAIDATGNEGQATSFAFTVDTAEPDVALTATPVTPGNVARPSFEFTSEADDLDHFECRVMPAAGDPQVAAPWTTCESGDELDALADGDWTFEVRALDTAGNASQAATFDFTVDTAAPLVTVTGRPATPGNDATPTFTYAADPSADVDHFECVVAVEGAQSASPEVCAPSGFTAPALEDGSYVFGVTAVDAVGNRSDAALVRFTVDTTAPETTVTDGPAAVIGTGSAAFGFASSESPATFECRLSGTGGADWQACADSSKAFSGLTDGTWTFEVRASDTAGNTDATPATRKVVVNLGLPTITAAVSGRTPATEFGWYRDAVTITYTCDGHGSALVAPCPAPRQVPRAQQGKVVFRASIATVDGDTATVSTALLIDKGKPKVRIKGFDARKTYTSVPEPRCKASDPRSGLDGCTIKVTKVRHGGEVVIVVRAKATDRAGNVRVVTKRAQLRAS